MRTTILLLLALCLTIHTYAQSSTSSDDAKRWKPGFVVTLHDDTIHGKVKTIQFMDTYYDYQRKLAFEHEGIVSEYMPVDLKSFSFYDSPMPNAPVQLITLESVSDPQGGGHIFSKLYCNGACRVYGYTMTLTRENESTMSTGAAMMPSLLNTEKKYIQMGHSEFIPLKMIGFRKNMKEIFAMCPVLLARLENKQYTYDNWQALVKDYNCGICK